MTAPSFLLFSCFQAFFAALSRPVPLSRPPFVTNLLRQSVSDLFQFYAAFPLPSRLISFSVTFSLPSHLIPFSVIFSLPYCLISIFRHILTSVPPYFIFCHILTSVLPYSIFCCILASVPPYSLLLFATFSASIILSVHISRAIILSASPTYTKSIYIITKCYFKCRFGSNLYSPSTVKYLFFYLPLDSVNRFM